MSFGKYKITDSERPEDNGLLKEPLSLKQKNELIWWIFLSWKKVCENGQIGKIVPQIVQLLI